MEHMGMGNSNFFVEATCIQKNPVVGARILLEHMGMEYMSMQIQIPKITTLPPILVQWKMDVSPI